MKGFCHVEIVYCSIRGFSIDLSLIWVQTGQYFLKMSLFKSSLPLKAPFINFWSNSDYQSNQVNINASPLPSIVTDFVPNDSILSISKLLDFLAIFFDIDRNLAKEYCQRNEFNVYFIPKMSEFWSLLHILYCR